MQVIFDYVDMQAIYDKMHDYFANMQHYKVDTPREFTWQILKDYLLRLKKNYAIFKKYFADRHRRTDGWTDIKQTDTWTSIRQTYIFQIKYFMTYEWMQN